VSTTYMILVMNIDWCCMYDDHLGVNTYICMLSLCVKRFEQNIPKTSFQNEVYDLSKDWQAQFSQYSNRS
jgi:hypothetical protein